MRTPGAWCEARLADVLPEERKIVQVVPSFGAGGPLRRAPGRGTGVGVARIVDRTVTSRLKTTAKMTQALVRPRTAPNLSDRPN